MEEKKWRIIIGSTFKGSKEDCVNVNLLVGISHSRGAVLCHHYEKAVTADKMVQIIETAMPEAFDKSIDSFGRKVLMEGCPS